jgi:hypothetical protein
VPTDLVPVDLVLGDPVLTDPVLAVELDGSCSGGGGRQRKGTDEGGMVAPRRKEGRQEEGTAVAGFFVRDREQFWRREEMSS